MALALRARPLASTRSLTLLPASAFAGTMAKLGAATRNWIKGHGLKGKPGDLSIIPGRDGTPQRALAVIAGDGGYDDFWSVAGLAFRLPEGSWKLDPEPIATEATRFALAWALGGYVFTRYKAARRAPAELVMPVGADARQVLRSGEATAMLRDLVNTPAEDMGPGELAAAATAMAGELGMTAQVIVGDDLLARDFPLVHAVGRAAKRAPRLIELNWGVDGHPSIAVLGKGVCFDTGGLDLKPSSAMLLMKKDMGGAAHALALARMIVEAKLAVRLRVLIPAVENAVSGDSIRPLDIVRSRKGITVEIGNTDAEGRLVLADALALASEAKPAMIVDFATLTGAARVALGPDLPALFCNDDALAGDLLRHGASVVDPLWRMPLWKPYRGRLDSRIADINNVSDGPFAGAVTAALFMQEFVGAGISWAHIDCYAWNPAGRNGRPEGADAHGLRAAFAMLAERYPPAAPPLAKPMPAAKPKAKRKVRRRR
jgi:leucyl aminopeptidase